MDRRTFLKISIALVAGAATGEVLRVLKNPVEKSVNRATGSPSGNAYIKQKVEEACKNNTYPQECTQNYEFSASHKVMGIVVSPILEELIFRATPSFILSSIENRENANVIENAIADTFSGTGGLKMNRREILVGAITSLLFGGYHNVTESGLDTKTIPASETLGGIALWYLQRKFGVLANTSAHALYNIKYLNGKNF